MDKKLQLIGKCGKCFYVDTENDNIGINGKAFMSKADVSYMKMKAKYKIVKKGGRKKVVVKGYNIAGSQLSWINLNGKVNMVRLSDSVKGRMHKITFRISGKEEGTADATVKHSSLTLSKKCFFSVYSKVKKKPGFMKDDDTGRYCATGGDHPNAGTISKYSKVKIKGKCGDFFYVKSNSNKCFVRKNKVAYLTFKVKKHTMKCYNTKKGIRANLVNSDNDKKIKFSLDKPELAEIKKTVVEDSKVKVHLYAKKKGKVTVTASYTNGGGVTIEKKLEIRINEVELETPKLEGHQYEYTYRVKLSWNKIANAKGYQVQVKDEANGKFRDLSGMPTTGNEHLTGEGKPEQTYYYRVRALY